MTLMRQVAWGRGIVGREVAMDEDCGTSHLDAGVLEHIGADSAEGPADEAINAETHLPEIGAIVSSCAGCRRMQ